MRVKVQLQSLKETRPREYILRFVAGGATTVLATLVAKHYGAIIGGMFLAFPAIFVPGISLVEKHKIEREAEEGKAGTISARGQAAVEATGASAGALGLAAFALVLWKGLPRHELLLSLLAACAAWAMVSCVAWWIRERM